MSAEANDSPVPIDALVGGTIVTMDRQRRIISDGAVAIAGGEIVALGKRADLFGRYRARQILGRPGAIVLPGFIDCHTHSTQSLLRGLIAGELPMIYRLYLPADMALTPAEAHVASKLCAAQLVRSGVTTVCDFETNVSAEHEDAVLAAFAEAGIRCNFLRSHGDQESHHAALYSQVKDRSWRRQRIGEAEKDFRRTEELIHRYARDPMVSIAVAPSSLLGFSDDYFRLAHDFAAMHGLRMHVHAARDREEVEFCLSVFGKRPIERLAELGMVDRRLVVVHGMLATADEIALLGSAGAGLAHSAVECANILSRVPDLPLMRRVGVTVGLGCDNAVNDMFMVMHSAWLMQTTIHGIGGYQPDIMNEVDVLAMATSDAAKLLGLERQVGSIEIGKAADLTVLDGNAVHMAPVQDPIPEIVRFGSRAEVDTVMVAGRVVIEKGVHTTLDVDTLLAEAATIAAKLRALVAPRRYRPPSGERLCLCS